MKILVVVATSPEIALLAEHFQLSKGTFLQSKDFDVLVTGVGMTATAFSLGRHLSNQYSLVLNLGIAGSFDKSIPLGTVLNIINDEFAELGAENGEQFLSIDELGFGKKNYMAFNNLQNKSLSDLQKCNGITVNTVHGNEESIRNTILRFNPTTESMEGAAVFFCCEMDSIPCLQVRGISNYVEPRNKETWEIGLAINNVNRWAIDFLTNA